MQDLKTLIQKYSSNGPRYTSYPTAPYFSAEADKKNLARLALESESALSLYVHIPFCKTLCTFCGCTSSVCLNPREVDDYLEALALELQLWRFAGLKRRTLKQIHFGGGTPNFLSPEQIFKLGKIIDDNFDRDARDYEFSVELDPRTLTREKLCAFAKIGVNRASIGVQDTKEDVQRAVNRIQPQQMNVDTINCLRELGIDKINIDLIYGLPLQTVDSFKKTIDDVLQLEPTRVALFGYAHVPWMKSAQKALEKYPMPNSEEKVEIFLNAKDSFESRGFEYIGLDHFALPSDALLVARKNGTLHRNFQGYTTKAGLDCFAIGLTSISETKTSYRQNHKLMPDYYASLKRGELPMAKGLVLDAEDLLRRAVIMDTMCLLRVDYNKYGVDFKTKFADAFPKLEDMQKDGLVQLFDDHFQVTQNGRVFIRNIAMLFDGRLANSNVKYSKTL